MLMLYISILALVVVLSAALRLASALRLTIPLLYSLVASTLFHSWYTANAALARGIGWALFAIAVLSWVLSAVKRIRELVQDRRDDRAAVAMFERRLRIAETNGNSFVSAAGLFRD